MKSNSLSWLLHLTLFTLGFALEDTSLLFVFAAMAGLFPRRRIDFWSYFSASTASLIGLYLFASPDPTVSNLIREILGLGSVHPFVIVAFVSSLTVTMTALAVNRITRKADKPSGQYI